ncbi:MAG: AAA family ATPase, partial [Lachnospiraceae bacterium]|nr:AAA family ATPase [Lachnospiraceae bacterium]
MGIYLNPENYKFQETINSEIYVDKTELIAYTNKKLHTEQKYICVSRPRRFGKSVAAKMLEAYYSRGCDSKELFRNYKIVKCDSFEKHLNKYDVITLNMQEFLSESSSMEEMLSLLKKSVLWDLLEEYPDYRYFDTNNLVRTMKDIYVKTKRPFIIIIDEWDCIFREYRDHREDQDKYLDFLRDLLKDKEYIYLAYMTGILPIKKYGTHSALNMFSEFSMTNPDVLAEFVGFTEKEVEALCIKYERNPMELKEWYNGYHFVKEKSVYNPKSVVQAVLSGICDTYWNRTETFEALRMYIDMNFEGLKDDV